MLQNIGLMKNKCVCPQVVNQEEYIVQYLKNGQKNVFELWTNAL